ncbi:MAG: DNRLRE domain-containing protein, partial [Planctomycetota bacterium]
MTRISTTAFASAMLLCLAPARASSVVLGASKDNTLYQTATGNSSNGAGSHFFAGSNAGGTVRRGVVQFDVAGNVPSGARILSVTLQLHVSKSRAGSHTTELHRVLADWGEGTSDAPGAEGSGTTPSTGDATWLHTFYPAAFWASKGGDFAPTASASIKVGGSGFYHWGSTADMVQ